MERITNRHLDHQLEILNSHFGIEDPTPDTVGSFYVGGCNGGFWLERVVNESGLYTDISKRGTKREIYEQLLVLNEGLRLFADKHWDRLNVPEEAITLCKSIAASYR